MSTNPLKSFKELLINENKGLIKLRDQFLYDETGNVKHPSEDGSEAISNFNYETGINDEGTFEWSFKGELEQELRKQASHFFTELDSEIRETIKNGGDESELYKYYSQRLEALIQASKKGEALKYPIIKKVLQEMLETINKRQGIIEEVGQKPGLPEIALLHYYEGIAITRKNADSIAMKHGWKSKNSGEALYQDYSRYTSRQNRVGKEATPIKSRNKLELLERVVSLLEQNKKAQDQAAEERNILKTAIEKED